MGRSAWKLSVLPLLAILLCGCGPIGEKSASVTGIYAVAALLSLVLLVGYCWMVRRKDGWFLLLLASVLVVNTGYFALSVSANLEQALTANRVSYLGSVFLPLSMWMIILRMTRIPCRKWLPGMLLGVGLLVFLIAASPGYLDIYYKEVRFVRTGGVSALSKVYGSFHSLYLFYLLGYFGAMVTLILYGAAHDKLDSPAYAAILAMAVLVNIGVWLIEQLVRIDFEFLSVSYIISELFLLGLHLFREEMEKQKAMLQNRFPEASSPQPAACRETEEPVQASHDQMEMFASGLCSLTPKERQLYSCYVSGMSTAQIMQQMNIKENTLKFHNKNLYSKLGVNSRKQLIALHRIASADTRSAAVCCEVSGQGN